MTILLPRMRERISKKLIGQKLHAIAGFASSIFIILVFYDSTLANVNA